MSDIVERLRRLYVQNGTNYVQEAADEIERLRAEIDRLRAERDDNAWWRKELADKLHDRETQISNAWAALRAAGVQSETNLADAIALLAKEQR